MTTRAKLEFRWINSLVSLTQSELREICADGHVFASPGWMTLVDRLNLSEVIGGQIELRFLVGYVGTTPVAVCPVMRARGEGVYFVYSMRQYFFEHWIEEAVRLSPEKKDHYARLYAGVSTYRRFLEWTGSKLDDCLIVTNPISYRCHLPVSPSSPIPREEVYAEMIAALQRASRQARVPLWFLGVEGEGSRFERALETQRCARSFLFYDNQIDLTPFTTFDDYLQSFRRTTRRAFQRDLRRTEEAGITLRFESDADAIARLAKPMSELYEQTYGKYGASHYHHPPSYWQEAAHSLGMTGEVILAEQHGRMIGFSLLLHSQRRGEMWTYRIGRSGEGEAASVPYYFALSFYGPIRRAIELGYRRIWLGPASYEAKQVRGARQVGLASYFWFPRKWDRWFLEPFLKLFGQVTREQIDETLRPKEEPAGSGEPSESTQPSAPAKTRNPKAPALS